MLNERFARFWKTKYSLCFTDTMRHIGAYGGRFAKIAPTPNLDRLADEGMIFKRCMVTNSICGPSRATILTGKYSHLNGFTVNEKQNLTEANKLSQNCYKSRLWTR